MRFIWILGFCFVTSLAMAANASAEELCPRSIGSASGPMATIKPKVALSASGPAEAINIGGARGIGTTDITVTASPALPSSVTPEQITLDIPKRFVRTGQGLPPVYLPNPTFSMPRILEHGTLVAFTLCVDASKISAGSYIGQVIVGGHPGIQPATVAITLNAKDEVEFIVGLVLAAIAAFLLLVLRGMKVNLDKLKATEAAAEATIKEARAKEKLALVKGARAQERGENDVVAAEKMVEEEEKGRAEAASMCVNQRKPVGKAIADTAKDPLGFWAPTLVAVGAAVVAMLQVYDANASWGADTIASLLALGGTAITAAGVGTFLSSLRGS